MAYYSYSCTVCFLSLVYISVLRQWFVKALALSISFILTYVLLGGISELYLNISFFAYVFFRALFCYQKEYAKMKFKNMLYQKKQQQKAWKKILENSI